MSALRPSLTQSHTLLLRARRRDGTLTHHAANGAQYEVEIFVGLRHPHQGRRLLLLRPTLCFRGPEVLLVLADFCVLVAEVAEFVRCPLLSIRL